MAAREDWKEPKVRDRIFQLIVLRMLWALCLKVICGRDEMARHTISFTEIDVIDFLEANSTNKNSTRETIKESLGW